MLIRVASPEDAPTIAEIHVRAWQAAYRGQLPDAYLDGLRSEARARRWRQLLADGVPVWVGLRGGQVLGFASAGPSRGEGEDVGEVYAIYLAPEVIGTGAGRALFAHAEAQLVARGFREAVLWVLDTNARTRRFYERAGWRADGGEKLETIGGAPAREIRYRASMSRT